MKRYIKIILLAYGVQLLLPWIDSMITVKPLDIFREEIFGISDLIVNILPAIVITAYIKYKNKIKRIMVFRYAVFAVIIISNSLLKDWFTKVFMWNDTITIPSYILYGVLVGVVYISSSTYKEEKALKSEK